MKEPAPHTILYDAECPMCALYSAKLVDLNWIPNDGRVPFQQACTNPALTVDWNRARNEIAVINQTSGKVNYGIDGLLLILHNRFPRTASLLQKRPFISILKHLYFFISFNRKVIAPGSAPEKEQVCTPSFNTAYRIAYIIFAWLITSLVLVQFFALGNPLIEESSFLREFAICAGQLVFQSAILAFIQPKKIIAYLGHVMTVSLAGAIALIPPLFATPYIDSPWFFVGWFAPVVILMFFEHARRVSLLNLPFTLSISWVAYRFIILFTILL